jgi:hypothetical protein
LRTQRGAEGELDKKLEWSSTIEQVFAINLQNSPS